MPTINKFIVQEKSDDPEVREAVRLIADPQTDETEWTRACEVLHEKRVVFKSEGSAQQHANLPQPTPPPAPAPASSPPGLLAEMWRWILGPAMLGLMVFAIAGQIALEWGQEQLKEKRYPQAERVLKAATTLSPWKLNAWLALAKAQIQNKHFAAARATASAALVLAPASGKAYALRSYAQTDPELMMKDARTATVLEDCAETWSQYVLACEHMGFIEILGCDEAAERAIALGTTEPEVFAIVAAIHSCRNQNAEAVAYLSHALTLDPNNMSYYSRRAHEYHALGDYQRAIEDYTRAINMDRGGIYQSRLPAERAKTLLANFQYSEALSDLKTPTDPFRGFSYDMELFLRGATENRLGKWSEAEADLLAYTSHHTGKMPLEVANELAYAQVMNNHPQQAKKVLLEAENPVSYSWADHLRRTILAMIEPPRESSFAASVTTRQWLREFGREMRLGRWSEAWPLGHVVTITFSVSRRDRPEHVGILTSTADCNATRRFAELVEESNMPPFPAGMDRDEPFTVTFGGPVTARTIPKTPFIGGRSIWIDMTKTPEWINQTAVRMTKTRVYKVASN